ncbi:MAG TPA: ATP-binding cassette domain-containing protein, partial [Geminicoccaceae bacterium]|nr:ATP-binding cassette domain-containing protein [Geminicoccaceae bacterium]
MAAAPRPGPRPGTVVAAPPTRPPAVRLVGIDKRFGPVHANRAVSMTIEAGRIHGIVGENGAGKSTCMNILYGFYRADSGTILIDGEPRTILTTQDAIRAGIGMVHQHFMLVEPFTVLENLLLGAEGGPLLKGGAARAREEIARLERDYGLEVDLDAVVGELPVGLQQRVEILRALFRGARILILDEPTGVLTPQEVDELFRILRSLREQGRTVVLITHKLREIMAATDTVTVMRQGHVVADRVTAETSSEELAELMVGRKVQQLGGGARKAPAARPGAPVLEVEDLTVVDAAGVARVKGVSFEVRAGEIVGIAGVAGNGQSELLEALGGIRPIGSGRATVRGHPIRSGEDRRGRPRGLGHVPEDRLRMGMVREFAAYE